MDAASWKRLYQAIEFYTDRGYTFIDAPWDVPEKVVNLTCPRPDLASKIDGDHYLVGSAEQSFLHLEVDSLGLGRYVALTPCFRVTDRKRGPYHQPYFMKVELYANLPDKHDRVLDRMIADATACFEHLGASKLEVQETYDEAAQHTRDIFWRGLELGSYGIRTRNWPYDDEEHTWVYGTGLAEPRFTQALKCL